MRKIVLIALGVAAAAASPQLSHATTLTLDFGSLPSAQGWTYETSGPAESAAYSVDGSQLAIDTIGGGATFSDYFRALPLDPTKPYSIAARARVTETETVVSGADASGLAIAAFLPSENNGITMNSTGVRVLSQLVVHPFDGTVFHDFLIDVTPGVREDIFVDGSLLYSGSAPAAAKPSPFTEFGNASSFENIRADISELVFRQADTVLPEPSGLLAVLAAVPAAMMLRRRRA